MLSQTARLFAMALFASAPFLITPSATAQENAQEAEVIYNHYKKCQNVTPIPDGCTINTTRQLAPGGTLQIWITHTRPALFDIDVRGYTVEVSKPSENQVKGYTDTDDDKILLDKPPSESLGVKLTHNARYGGYIVTITPKLPLPY